MMPSSTRAPNMTARSAIFALGFGNFAVGSGVLVVTGMLTELAGAFEVSVSTAGWLVTVAAITMGIGAPVVAAITWKLDRRVLLLLSLIWYAVGLAIAAFVGDFAALLIVRALTAVAAAAFMPQAAATAALIVPAVDRGRAVASTFLGWSIASVVGMPIGVWIAGAFGWRAAFLFVAVLASLAAIGVASTMPRGLYVPPINLQSWRVALGDSVVPLVLLVTVIHGCGQFLAFSYIAPLLSYLVDADSTMRAILLAWTGVFAVLGNVLLARRLDRIGHDRAVHLTLVLTVIGLATLGLGRNAVWIVTVALLVWGSGIFALASAQQARLVAAAPTYAGGIIALNTLGVALGQGAGTTAGGYLINEVGIGSLPWFASSLVVLAMAVSHFATRRARAKVSA